MPSSDISSVTKYFPTPAEGFSTTLASTITAGASTVPLNNTSGLVDGTVFVGIIEPGATAQQAFTGTVNIGSAQITNVAWTRGTNVGHASGVTVVDYVTGTATKMISTGILKQHTQAGVHTAITTDTITASAAATFNGGTVLPAGDIGTADIADSAITSAKIADATIASGDMQFGIIYRRQGGNANNWGTTGNTTFDVSTGAVKIQSGAFNIASTGGTDITFPVAFTNRPLIFVGAATASSHNVWARFKEDTSDNTKISSVALFDTTGTERSGEDVNWLAIGI